MTGSVIDYIIAMAKDCNLTSIAEGDERHKHGNLLATDERLNMLGGIAHDCFGVETFPFRTDQVDPRYVASIESIARALESAYDIGLIAGYRLRWA